MNDKILDDALTQLKAEKTPHAGEFSDAADFERKFFERAAREEALRDAMKRRSRKIFAFAAVFALAFGVAVTAAIPMVYKRSEPAIGGGGFVAEADSSEPKRDAGIEKDAPALSIAAKAVTEYKLMAVDAYAHGVCYSYKASKLSAKSKSVVACCKEPNASTKFGNIMFFDSRIYGTATAPQTRLNTEEYKDVNERPFLATATNPLSTFGADVDTAGYANLRRMILQEDRLPPANSIRIEELINYFDYDYSIPKKGELLRPCFEMGNAPWDPARKLLLVGVQAKKIPKEELPPSHYVFLIDNSGSMYGVFPMVKEAMTTLAKQLRPCDRVSMVTYGGGVSIVLDGCGDIDTLCRKIAELEPEGYTPGGEGIQSAYRLAEKHFIKGGNNRIILITDGDFNVGASSEAELTEMVDKKRAAGIYLSVAGCGMGNYKDNKMKMLANKGNGNYFYLDTLREAKQAFVHGMTGNMYTLAKDVKFQLEFNPAKVYAYRLIGYELRELADRDFRDDERDSGEVGIGQQVTALYEIIPADAPEAVKAAAVPGQKPLKYAADSGKKSAEFLTFRMRYQKPQGKNTAEEKEVALTEIPAPQQNWQWAAGVAEFGLSLRRSKFAPKTTFGNAAKRIQANLGDDPSGSRAEFLLIVKRAAELLKK